MGTPVGGEIVKGIYTDNTEETEKR